MYIVKLLVLINGSPYKEFLMSHGIRQDDPLSRFFFLIAEGLLFCFRKQLQLIFSKVFLLETAFASVIYNMQMTL
jgi:hypothetical protein